MSEDFIQKAKEHFAKLIEEQQKRVEKMKLDRDWVDYSKLNPLIIGICPGDGIGLEISKHATKVLTFFLNDEVEAGKIQIRNIDGLTIENRVKHMKAIPDDVLAKIKECHVLLKGPTTTPQAGDPWPNIESANVAMRRELDLFANIRPVKLPKENIDWMFYRENTECAYVLGSKGIDINDDISFDFRVITTPGTERIVRMAFEYAKIGRAHV